MSMPPVTTSLVLCYQADSYTGLADNTTVPGNWTDQSGGNHHATKQGSPKWRSARTPMGTPSVQLTGGSSGAPYFTIADNTVLNAATTAEMFVVLKSDDANNIGPVHLGGGGNFYPHPSGPGNNSIYCTQFIHSTAPRSNYANPGVSAWHIFNVSHDGTTKINRHNGTDVHTQTVAFTTPGSSGVTGFEIGFWSGADHKYTGEFAEILVYSAVLNSTDRTAVYDYLHTKHIDDGRIIIAAPPAVLTLSVPAPAIVIPVDVSAPPADVLVDAPAPRLITATIELLTPADDTLLPTARPVLSAAVTSTDPTLRVEFEYDTDPDFTDPDTLITDVATGLSTITVTARVPDPLTDETTYFWRARAVNDYDTTDWAGPNTFTTSFTDGDALLSGGWTVTTATTPLPHLWFVYPDLGHVGDTARAYGTGFGTTVTVYLAGVSAPVTDVSTVDATADAHTADRAIDPYQPRADPRHQVVTFTVPAVDYPGGPLYVDGS